MEEWRSSARISGVSESIVMPRKRRSVGALVVVRPASVESGGKNKILGKINLSKKKITLVFVENGEFQQTNTVLGSGGRLGGWW